LITELKIAIIAIALVVASYQDLRLREVDDRIWLIAGAVGGVLTLVEILTTAGYPLLLAGFSILLTAALALGISYGGLFGGADAKALIAIAVTFPIPPYQYTDVSPSFPITVLGNGLVLTISLVVLAVVANLVALGRGERLFEGIKATGPQKVAAFFTGLKVKPETARTVHFDLIERVSEGGGRHLRLFKKVEEMDEPKLITPGVDRVWVTPAIPMIVFFLFGYILALVGLDILIRGLTFLLQIL